MIYSYEGFSFKPFIGEDGEAYVKATVDGKDSELCYIEYKVKKVHRNRLKRAKGRKAHPSYNYAFVVVEDCMSKENFALVTTTFVRNIDAIMKSINI